MRFLRKKELQLEYVIADKIKQNTNNIAAASSASSGMMELAEKEMDKMLSYMSQFRQKVLINSGNQAVSQMAFINLLLAKCQ